MRPSLSARELETRRLALERRVPGWTIRLTPDGFPGLVESGPVGPYEERISPERVIRVQRLLRALASELQIAADVIALPDDRYISVSSPSARGTSPMLIQQVPLGDGQVAIRLEATQPEPSLPAGVREMTDDELRASWGAGWQTREVRVVGETRGQPCDQVVGERDACSSAGPRPISQCLPATTLPLIRRSIRGGAGLRRVVHIGDCSMVPGTEVCRIEMAFPDCIDAVTGEFLPGAC